MNRNIQPELQGEQKDELKSSEDHFWGIFGSQEDKLFQKYLKRDRIASQDAWNKASGEALNSMISFFKRNKYNFSILED